MERPRHYAALLEARARSYEVGQLINGGYERAIGLAAIVATFGRLNIGASEAPTADEVNDGLRQLRDCMEETADLRNQLAIDHGERTRPYSLRPYQDFAHMIDAAAAMAYFAYAKECGVRQDQLRQRPGACTAMFFLMQQALRKRGIESEHMWWFETGNNHHFLRTTNVQGRAFVVDATWQQALPIDADYDSKPHVFIAPADCLEEALELHDVPVDKRCMWLAAKVDHEDYDPGEWDPALAAVFATDPRLSAAVEL